MAAATITEQDPTGVLVPLLAAAAHLVASDPDRRSGAEAVSQTRETFVEFIGIVGEGEQILVIQQDRAQRAAEWDDTEKCDLYTGICLGAYRERSAGGGTVTRMAVWVRAFDKDRMCESYEDARDLWRDHRSEPDAFAEKTGILYLNGIKSARAPFSGEMELDAPGQVIKRAKELQGHPVKMYRRLHDWDDDGYAREVGVVHRIELNVDADDGGADEEVEEAAAPKRSGGSKSTRSTSSRSSTSKSGTKAGQTRSSSSRSTSSRSSTSKSGSTRKSTTKKPAEPDPEPQDDEDVPATKQALVKWATGEGVKRGALNRFLEECGYEGGLPGLTEDDLAEAYGLIVDGISNGSFEI
ncbi:MAG: hypothetical protein F4Z31_02235 [Gemmatimonadetes bacterium]|nr:hypothetical protein [Gemmatimonadota bacterium]